MLQNEMKFICNRSEICTASSNVQKAVSGKSSLPALEGILVKAENGYIAFTGYDLELGIITKIEANVEKEGKIILNAKLFCDILRKLPGETVSVELEDKMVIIRSGEAEFSILGIAAEEYPELPLIDEKKIISIKSEILKSMINQTAFAVAVTDVKPVHTGILFESEGDTLRLIAVDGYRLAIRSEKIPEIEPMNFVVPAKTLNEMIRLAQEEEEIKLHVGNRHIQFEIGDYMVISRLLDGEFLDYKAAVPKNFGTEVIVNTSLFIEAIERISLLITDRLKSPVRCAFDKESIKMRCTTSMGKACDQLPCSTEGEPVEIGFNNRYFLDALKAADTDQIKIQLSGALSPIKIVPMDGNEFLFLVLPVRLKAE